MCNLKCRHCFNYSGEQDTNNIEMNTEELVRVAVQMTEVCPTTVCLCGGEPLLKFDAVLKMIKVLKQGGVQNVNMVSNGFLLTDKHARKLKEAGVGLVQISIDGATKSTHNWLRNNPDSFEKAIYAIKNLKSMNINVNVAYTPTKRSLHEFDNLVDMLDSLDVSLFRSQPIMNLGRAKNIQEYYLTDEEYTKLALNMNLKSASRQYKMKFEWGDSVEHFYSYGRGDRIKMICVNPYGDILISPYIPVSFGNVKKYTIKNYIDSGLLGINKKETVKKLFKSIIDELSMDLSTSINLPPLYKGELFDLDIIDKNIDERIALLENIIEKRC